MSDRVTISIDGGVADVRLNRAEKLNALDAAMFDALIEAGEALKADASLRAVVISGEGRAFCAGLDLGSFQAMASGPERVLGDVGEDPQLRAPRRPRVSRRCYVWREIPAPVIAAVNGHALGGGFQLALGADLRYVHPGAQMSVLEIRWGLIPDMCGTQLLHQLVGLEIAKDLTFSGRMVAGDEAVRIGLASRLTETPREDALATAHEYAAKSPQALRGGKALLNMADAVPLSEGFAAEQKTIRALIGTPNQVEAVTAWFEKRPPSFSDPA